MSARSLNRSLRALPARQCQSLEGGRPLHGLKVMLIGGKNVC
jgi:hypothetical protein